MAGKLKMDYTEEFDTFWIKYPARWNRDFRGGSYVKRRKRPAFDKWQKLSQKIRNECMAKVHLIKEYEGGSVRDCVTWLNQCGWEDIPEQKPKPFVTKKHADSIFQPVCEEIDVNDERNRQRKGLGL